MCEPTFEQKIVRAALFAESGDPIKDVLDDFEIIYAIKSLSDIYVTLGIVDISEID